MLTGLLLLSFGGCGVVAIGYVAWSLGRNERTFDVRKRVRELSRNVPAARFAGLPARETASRRGPDESAVKTLKPLLPDSAEDRRRYELRLKQAGLTRATALMWFFTARLLGLIIPFVVLLGCGYLKLILLKQALTYAVAAGAMGWLLPSFWLDRQISRRHAELRRSLPDFMDLLIVCLESGLSVPAALQRVTEEISLAHPALARELEIVQHDVALGASVDVAFQRFAERSGLDAVRILATLLRESRRFGSEIVDALRSHAESMRFQREQAAEENAQKASVKILFPMLLLILPAVFVVLAGPAVIQIQKAFAK